MPRRSGVAAKAGCQPASPLTRVKCGSVSGGLVSHANTGFQILTLPRENSVEENAMLQRSGHEPACFFGLQRRHHNCLTADMRGAKRFVYVLTNAESKSHFYVGLTSDVFARLSDHNAGRCSHTASRRPWQVHVVIEFADE